MAKKTDDELIQEGRNQALYLLLTIGDEYVAHDNWAPEMADFLYKVRLKIVHRLKWNAPHWPALGGNWPEEYPDFETYTWTPG